MSEEYSDFNPFDFEYDEDSRLIYSASTFLFRGAELYWIAGALNWEHHLGNWDFREMCIFHVRCYTEEKREECAENIRNKEYSFTA